MRDALARELLGVCMDALQTYGLERKRLLELVREVAGESKRQPGCATGVLSEALLLGEIITKWGEDSLFLDPSGRPAVLRIEGTRKCFAVLAKEFLPARSVADVVSLGCRARVIERIGNDKVAQLNNIVLFTGNSFLQLAHSVRTIRWFLSTAHFNRHVKPDSIVGRPDREAHVELCEEDFAEFLKIVRPQISGLVEMSNRWLSKRSSARKARVTSVNTRVSGIQAFVFRE